MPSATDRETALRGVQGDLSAWIDLHRRACGSADLLALVPPFPPTDLMQATSGITERRDFASHGADILNALAAASPVPVSGLGNILEFGIGAGRLARMFHGLQGRYVGLDVDPRNVVWINQNLDHAFAVLSAPRESLPLGDEGFRTVISISVFTHLSRRDHFFYLEELRRVTKPGALLFLTVHGERALTRAMSEPHIFAMMSVPEIQLRNARAAFDDGDGYWFIRQRGHLTSVRYDYGMTFIDERFVRSRWSTGFEVLAVVPGAIHEFQDIVVLRRT